MTTLIDYSGTRQGMLYISHRKERKQGATYAKTVWVCTCDCGNKIELRQIQLKRGRQDCGCITPLCKIKNRREATGISVDSFSIHHILDEFITHYRRKYASLRADQWNVPMPETRYCQIPQSSPPSRLEICLRGMR